MASPFVDTSAPSTAPAPTRAFAPEPGKVAIRDLDGSVSKIAAGDLDRAQLEGARPASEAEYYGAKSGTGGQAAEALYGAARGISFGFSDPITIEAARSLGGEAAAEDVRRGLSLSKEAFPGTSLVGEIGGALAPMAIGLGPGGAAASGETFFGRAAARAVEAAPRAFGEGVVMATGHKASEDALQGHPFVAESYVRSGLEGGAIGVLLGSTAAAGIGALADRFAPRFGRAVESAVERHALRAAEAEAPAARGILSRLEEQGEAAAFRAAGAGKADFRKLGQTVEEQTAGAARLGRRVQELAEREGETFATMPQAKIAKMVAKETSDVGADLGRMRKELDTRGFERPSVRTISQRFQGEVWPEIRAQYPLRSAEELAKADDFIQRMGKLADDNGQLSFEKLHAIRKEIEGSVSYKRMPGVAPAAGEEATKALRTLVEEEFTRAAEKASAEVGEEFANKYRLAKESYADLKALKTMSASKAAGDAAGSSIQLKDLMLGAAAAAATGGPGGLLAPVVSKLGREYGNQVAAYTIRKLTKLRSAAAGAEQLDQALERGAKDLFSGKAANVADKTLTSDEVRAIRSALSTPELIERRISESLGDLPRSAPRLAASVAATLTRAATYLRDTLPRSPAPTGAALQSRPPLPIPASQLRAASQAVEVIDDPTIVIERMKQGRLTNAHVRALEAVHPETYQRMQGYIRNHAEELRRKLTVQEEIKLSLLFRQPINETLKPSNVAAFQQVFLPPAPPEEKKGVGSNIANVSPAAGGTRATSWDKQEADL